MKRRMVALMAGVLTAGLMSTTAAAQSDESEVQTTMYESGGYDVFGRSAGQGSAITVVRGGARFDGLDDLQVSFLDQIGADAASTGEE